MALAVSGLASGVDSDGGTSATSASISPTGDALVICDVLNFNGDASAPPATPTVAGNSLTWTQVATLVYADLGGGEIVRCTRFRAMGASPSSGTVVISCGVAQAVIAYSIYEITGVDTSGTHGSGAVVQTVTNSTAGATSLTVTLSAFGSANNMAIGGFGYGLDTSDFTLGTGFTLIHEAGGGSFITEYRLNDTTVDITNSTSQALGGIASEIKEAGGGGGLSIPVAMAQYRQRWR